MFLKQLWLFGLNPEVSTWNEIQQGAETIETSEKFTDPQHCRNNISGGGSNGNSGPNSHCNNHNNPGGKSESERNCSGSLFSWGSLRTHSVQRSHSLQPGPSKPQSLPTKGNSSQFNNGKKDCKGGKPANSQWERSTPCLSDKEKSELLASGSCFNCKKLGQLSCNCPNGNVVKSNNNELPGLANYNIEIIPEVLDKVEVLDHLELRRSLLSPTCSDQR